MTKDSLLTWDFELPRGGAIYCLADEDGKRYVGQTRNLPSRLRMHRTNLDYAHTHPTEWFFYNQKLIRAARDGMHFKAECLRILPDDADVAERSFWEEYYINKFGGLYLSYNINPAPYISFPNNEYENPLKCSHYKAIRYVLKESDARAIESCQDTKSAIRLMSNIKEYTVIDDRLLCAMEEIPSGLKTLVG